MTTHSASDLLTKPKHLGQYGEANIAHGKVAPSAAALNDVIRPCIIPAGSEVSAIILANDDLDSNGTPLLAVKIGYTPVNSGDGSLVADDDYFVAAGDTTLQAANGGKVFAKFTPKKFEQDVYLDITVSAAAATFAAGTVYAQALGRNVGVK